MQYYKGDALELKFDQAGEPTISVLTLQKDLFYADAYSCAPLGDMIYVSGRSPLSNAIPQEIFRIAFKEIFDAFVKVGTFEAYLTVFSKIFGDDVVVEFTVPDAGKLEIDIEATGVELSDLLARYILDNSYLFDEIVDEEGDNLALQTIKGFQSQYELEQMLNEMVPAGVYTNITLTLGE